MPPAFRMLVRQLGGSGSPPPFWQTEGSCRVPPVWWDHDRFGFSRLKVLENVVSDMLRQGTFTRATLARQLRSRMQQGSSPPAALAEGCGMIGQRADVSDPPVPSAPSPSIRPLASDVEALATSCMLSCGSSPLPPSCVPLDAAAMLRFHVPVCPLRDSGERCTVEAPSPTCYFVRLFFAVTHGWLPALSSSQFVPKYHLAGGPNQRSAARFPAALEAEITKLVASGVARRVPAPAAVAYQCVDATHPGPLPMGVSITASDRARVLALCGASLSSPDDLDKANAAIGVANDSLPPGVPPARPVKLRPIHNATQPGINAALITPSFTQSGLLPGLQLITRNCWLAKGDLSSYFNSFAFARECADRRWFHFLWRGETYVLDRVFFGLGPAPYFTTIYGAELLRVLQGMGVPCTNTCDDWLTSGATREEARSRLDMIRDTATGCGYGWNPSKDEVAQVLTYLGIVFDTTRMVIRMPAASCRSLALEIRRLLEIRRRRPLRANEVEHICGKLNWMSEVCQAGRAHTTSWYLLSSLPASSLDDHALWRTRFDSDNAWWLARLDCWGANELAGCEYPIRSAQDLLASPGAIHVLQSDASGDSRHGFGYFHGALSSENPRVFAQRWESGFRLRSTQYIELRAPEHFLLHAGVECQLLIWVTDSIAAAYAVNKGAGRGLENTELLCSLLDAADAHRIDVVAIWLPRELNSFADFLSHLAFIFDRDSVSAAASDFIRA